MNQELKDQIQYNTSISIMSLQSILTNLFSSRVFLCKIFLKFGCWELMRTTAISQLLNTKQDRVVQKHIKVVLK